MWNYRKEQEQSKKLRTKDEIKEGILDVLTKNRGRIITPKELTRALPIRKLEEAAFKQAFNELVTEGKIKQYIGLP
jgi:hypothetical protein